MKYLYTVQIVPGIRYKCRGDAELKLKRGDEVIVRCERYLDNGVIIACEDKEPLDEARYRQKAGKERKSGGRRIQGWRLPTIERHPTLRDRSRIHENEARERAMIRTCRQKIAAHQLAMKLIGCHCSFDRKLLVFQFTAEGRVDFRELVQDLNREFHTRVELIQVGVRDEAAIQGGIGCCGRPFCCGTFLKDLSSVNVKMAKDQGLSLNPASISGACGRLKCCLRFEAEGYREMRRGVPRNGSRCETPEGPGKILDTNVLMHRARVRLDDDSRRVEVFSLDEISRPPPPQNKPRSPK